MEDPIEMYVPIGGCPKCGNSMIFRLSELGEGKPLNCPDCVAVIDRDIEPWIEVIPSIRKLHEKANKKIRL
jgi:predicted RNA-binding Zn-ribbon protein involved in translation (DUF1610 family)